ncbi:zinc-binding dehydrogenase [Streptacidiphilus fuscans]|uniref:Alcohol dehydrogenase catalytic domain-containing protein n=1 Tax=Streptacidiphilus fuscans TaxID=2789292 RepID=A0A931FF35_9ACTN|nr:alcohol dehydrogenase catalytic domain-containing protein [Streptacidiphilus fuscans]MBF9069875.1 alcohol dehydrogenase catalytic domain-containing protein [Streptacidiphilus fuscans]MBF9073451.1 alcohol dehydrogenase catalytic domain-containing protein [Streptacidiphilus fuscans]
MRATLLHQAGDVRVADVADPKIQRPTDAVVRIVLGCICGSDLWPYKSQPVTDTPRQMGHEFIGVVEETGTEVRDLKAGDVVVAPFTYSDGTCESCREGLQTSCEHGGPWGVGGVDGGQGQATRVPYADGTLVKLPVGEDSELLPDLLTLSDVLCTGYHAARTAGVRAGETVTVIGDGAVGLSAVIAAKLLGAERIVLMGRHTARTDLGREFGATDVVAARGEEGVAAVRELTGGRGAHRVLECVGLKDALVQAAGVVRDGGTISRVGAPQYAEVPLAFPEFLRNITLTGGVAPARAYIGELMPHILDGRIRPGRVFDRTVPLEQVAEGYRLMNDREALKVIVRP